MVSQPFKTSEFSSWGRDLGSRMPSKGNPTLYSLQCHLFYQSYSISKALLFPVLNFTDITESHVMGPSLEFKQPVHDIRALFEVGSIQALNPGYEET